MKKLAFAAVLFVLYCSFAAESVLPRRIIVIGADKNFSNRISDVVAAADTCPPDILHIPVERCDVGMDFRPDTVIIIADSENSALSNRSEKKKSVERISGTATKFRRSGVLHIAVVAGFTKDQESIALLREGARNAQVAFIEAGGIENGDFAALADRVLDTLGTGAKIHRSRLRVRDPYIVTDKKAGLYRLYETYPWFGGAGVFMRKSRDLETWSEKKLVTSIPQSLNESIKAWWAPEMHEFNGKYYLLVTLWRPERSPVRGTWIFGAESPDGPFVPVADNALTPKEWDSIDGTLWTEDSIPYMVFGRNWNQTGEGSMNIVELQPGLDGVRGEHKTLFKATDYTASPVFDQRKKYVDRVSEGPYMFRSAATGMLHMLWSNLLPTGYAVMVSDSRSGKAIGPWTDHRVLFASNGGHGMVFRRLDGRLSFALHQPNSMYNERMKIFALDDGKSGLAIREER
jgi:hypothetical protein